MANLFSMIEPLGHHHVPLHGAPHLEGPALHLMILKALTVFECRSNIFILQRVCWAHNLIKQTICIQSIYLCTMECKKFAMHFNISFKFLDKKAMNLDNWGYLISRLGFSVYVPCLLLFALKILIFLGLL